MRVAVYLGQLSAAAAGGFTFQDDIVTALRSSADARRHSFVLVSANRPTDWRDFDASVFSFVPGPNESFVRFARACAVSLPGGEFVLRRIGVKTALDRRLRAFGVDFIWFVTPYYAATDLPYVYTVWDLQHRIQPWFPEVSARGRWEYREFWYSRAVQRASLVITPNRAGQHELQSFYGLPGERILRLAHPTPAFALAAAESGSSVDVCGKFGLQKGFLLYPAQFWPHKNHVLLLKALQVLKRDNAFAPQLVLVGPDQGNLAYVEAQAAALGVRDQVRILGFVERGDLIGLYRNAAALVYVSFFGPENLPPLEAFALGCPVIATRVSGAEEQLGDAACLVDATNPQELAQAIAAVIQDPALRQRLSSRGRERAISWTAVDYVREVLAQLHRLDAVRDCWPKRALHVPSVQ